MRPTAAAGCAQETCVSADLLSFLPLRRRSCRSWWLPASRGMCSSSISAATGGWVDVGTYRVASAATNRAGLLLLPLVPPMLLNASSRAAWAPLHAAHGAPPPLISVCFGASQRLQHPGTRRWGERRL